jgi:methionyl-tRNA formyltransferase
MRIVFFGTAEFSVRIFDAVFPFHDIVGVVTQPDREKDRKGRLKEVPLKVAAKEKGIPVIQCQSVSDEKARLEQLGADIFVTASFGQILKKDIIFLPKYGTINVHTSLLPKYRGSSPVQTAILCGEKETGVTIMQTAEGLDTGDILLQEATKIGENENSEELTLRLAEIGGRLLLDALKKIENETIVPAPQDEKKASKCKMIKKEMGLIDWSQSGENIVCLVRAIESYTYIDGLYVKILRAEVVQQGNSDENINKKKNSIPDKKTEVSLSEILPHSSKKEMIMPTGDGLIRIITLKPQGKNIMSGADFLRGRKP